MVGGGGGGVYLSISLEIWKEIWSHDRDITDNSILTSALMRSGIPDKKVRHYFESAEKPEIKKVS